MPRNAGDRRVALVTLGCARNEVDSEELAGRLAGDGWELVDAADDADVVLVNTCGFVEQAKKDSVDTLLTASDSGAKVVAAGCMAERYGAELATALPEADAVLGFDDYAQISDRLNRVLAGEELSAHTPVDRRTLLPITPVERSSHAVAIPGHADLPEGVSPASGPRVLRRRLEGGPVAPLKLASGCDRRCAFCAIPSFRGAFVSRRPTEILEEARWLASQGVREVVLVSENSSSYGKDLGDPRLLETLLPELAAVPGIVRVRVSYLQPAETRPSLIKVIATTPGVVPYFDLSFQHSSEPVLRRMRRFGSTERFLELLAAARELAPEAGVRSNFIVGFPGETKADVAELARFLTEARLDAVGVFGYSDEDGTEAATLPGKIRRDTIDRRYDRISRLAEELTAQRAEERHGQVVEVLVESVDSDSAEGRAEHQAPEVDGSVTLRGDCPVLGRLAVGDLVRARVTGSLGVDLDAEVLGVVDRVGVDPAVLDRGPNRVPAPAGSGG
ncbi:30S ribosomal protein S12 methylthiotransferase RimO [Cryptosporangium aurantiacum]|uniref:Ribosomal protein uS12 methylthiotransferase RimO n=1 Tax=Cryptosporangium aurantiacum TaxID=134849 RepID=A0A1M7ISX1_9ACTN|nr:30S ribosomal protein S12 methylthiotransferase RimO [Cryptosporangium aurantiacum]SHM43698.1 SSU ribosomal protein S12P methylthiotransferase [Cryptosporangium aurantiacum]